MEVFKSPKQAYDELQTYRAGYYDRYSALYSGNHEALKNTGEPDSFWRRGKTKRKMHVPIASDIATTSANLLFGEEPTFNIFRNDEQVDAEAKEQDRLNQLVHLNGFENRLAEAAETCAAMGDVYLKLRWNKSTPYPMIDIVQADKAWAEFIFGDLVCLHCFSEFSVDTEKNVYIRIYERYTKGNIHMEMFRGDSVSLGSKMDDSELIAMGYEPDTKCPVDEMMCVHIANVRPNRNFRWSRLGRSDYEGMRDLTDALDETYSSWIRDIRLAKAKLIVPVDYLRRKPQEMLDGVASSGSWEFDPDIETYVAMDIQTSETSSSTGITSSQFAIRSNEHSATANALLMDILQMAGYSPQTFGYNINGSAESGTALNIREKKTYSTVAKKQTYWIAPLEHLMTVLVKLDAALFGGLGSGKDTSVKMKFGDIAGQSTSEIASTIEMLFRAQAASVDTRIRLLHPDWEDTEINDEIERVTREFQIMAEDAITEFSVPDRTAEEPTE